MEQRRQESRTDVVYSVMLIGRRYPPWSISFAAAPTPLSRESKPGRHIRQTRIVSVLILRFEARLRTDRSEGPEDFRRCWRNIRSTDLPMQRGSFAKTSSGRVERLRRSRK